MDGIQSTSSITTTVVETDTSRSGGQTGVTLTKDSEGSFYIRKQDGSDLAIIDDAAFSIQNIPQDIIPIQEEKNSISSLSGRTGAAIGVGKLKSEMKLV